MTRNVRDEYGFLLVTLTDEERLRRMDDLAARQILDDGTHAFDLLTRLLRGQICRDKLTVDEREAKEKARNKRQRGVPVNPGPTLLKETRNARAAMTPEEILASNADYVAKDREKKGEYRKRPEVLERSRELQRLYRRRNGVPIRQAMPTEAAIPTPTLADGLTWPTMPTRAPIFAGARVGGEWYHRPDDAATRRIKESLASVKHPGDHDSAPGEASEVGK